MVLFSWTLPPSPTSTLFPYTTLFRSPVAAAASAPWLLGRSARRAARRGVVVPGGEDQRRPVGHLQRVLRVGAAGAVGRELGPAIALVHHELGGGGHEERLDGDQLPGHELDAAAGGAVVGHERGLVHGAPHPVAAEAVVDRVAEP